MKDHAVAQVEPQFEATRAAEFERAGVDEASGLHRRRGGCVLGSPSRLRQRRKLDSLSLAAQNGSIPGHSRQTAQRRFSIPTATKPLALQIG